MLITHSFERRPVAGFVACLTLILAVATASATVTVVSVDPGGEAARAGIQSGDLLRSWTAAAGATDATEYEIRTPHDLEQAEIELPAWGEVVVHGERQGVRVDFRLALEDWGMVTRSAMTGRAGATYQAAETASSAEQARQRWPRLRDAARRRAADDLSWWLSERAARHLMELGDASGCLAVLDEASAGKRPPRPFIASLWSELEAEAALGRSSPEEAERACATGMQHANSASSDGLALARLLYRAGVAAWQRGHLDTADALFCRALEIRHRSDPGSLAAADSLNSLGLVAWRRGRLDQAEELFQGAMTVAGRLRPGTLLVASYLNNLGLIARARGDLPEAEARYREALAIRERLAPVSAATAVSLNNLGNLARIRGDLVTAEQYHLRSIAIKERLAPRSEDVAVSWINLGTVARHREDLERAEQRCQRAVEILEQISPDSLDLANALECLGEVAVDRLDLDAAEEHQRRVMAIRERSVPGSLEAANSLVLLGEIDALRGHPESAALRYNQAYAMYLANAPASLFVADALEHLSDLATGQKDLRSAEKLLREALVLHQRLAPGSRDEADDLHVLGLLCLEQGRVEEALGFLEQAVAALEANQARLGGGAEAAERFAQSTADCFRDLVELQLRLGQPDQAVHTLERFRARAFLEMLAERDLDFRRDATPELLTAQRRAALEHARLQDQLSQLNLADNVEEADQIHARLLEVGDERRRIDERIRQTSPRLAALQNPEPLTKAEASALLGPGTLLLSYSTGERHTQLLALLGGELHSFTIDLDRSELTAAVVRIRVLLTTPHARRDLLERKEQELYRTLVEPASALVGRAEQIVVCPDGPLHYLPFVTLRDGGGRHLLEDAPLFNALSVTVLGEQRRQSASPPRDRLLAAFGDPVYGDERPEPAGSVDRGHGLHATQPLPGSRREVERIAEVFAGRVQLHLGAEASEAAAKELGLDQTHVHFACHALLDDRFPLNSGLLLSEPSGDSSVDNGLLQAWEIFEGVRLEAELVTLSACESGLGTERGGEGLVGLTRAFLYAGARSVVSSLWEVPDVATAELMGHFYGRLAAGVPKAAALRAAQLEVAGKSTTLGPEGGATEAAHPFYWAAFQLIGDGW